MRTIAPCSQCGCLQRQLHKSLAHQSTPTTRLLPCLPRQRRHQHKRQAVAAGAAASAGKFISSAEIPAFIPRKEFLEQLASWATVQVDTEGPRKFGLPMKVTMISREENPAFKVSFVRDGQTLTDISVAFDGEMAVKSEWVGRGPEGFPQMEGNVTQVRGKHLIIRKDDDNKIDEDTRGAVRIFCNELAAAINKYYAFGNCFVDDAQ